MKRIVLTLIVAVFASTAGAAPVTVTDSINTRTEVDHWRFSLSSSTDLTIDVAAFEGCGSGNSTGFFLNTQDTFGNGAYNDKLLSHIFLFSSTGTLIGSGDADYFSGPGRHSTQSGQDPYLSLTNLAAGDYLLAIGADGLNPIDAWSRVNNDLLGTWFGDPTDYHNYQITLDAASDNMTGPTFAPVPLPAAILLFGSGLFGLVALRRKKRA